MKYSKPSLQNNEIKYFIEEINSLNKEIHQYLRLSPLFFSIAVSVFPLIIAQAWGGKVTDFTLLLAPIVLSILTTYVLNIAAEARALAVIRDRLSVQVNKSFKHPIFLMESHGAIRRGSMGTIASYSLGIIVVLFTMTYGLIHANLVGGWLFELQVVTTVLSIVAILVGFYDFFQTRTKISKELDKVSLKSLPK